ncbi:hypothetical protein [Psychrobacillus sp. L3]|uniref:hypothetical protein n=1 Tax=Psychrobacillus sp. L3 TaxID=3236891 RepID=UPI0036F3283C
MNEILAFRQVDHPVLVEATQIAPNQISITYDQPADFASATNVSNYWIRSNMGPIGIATVGMNDPLMSSNAIRPEIGMITPVSNSKTRFVMSFRVNAMTGVMYTVLPCFVNLEGRTGFMGENWGPLSRNMFIGM